VQHTRETEDIVQDVEGLLKRLSTEIGRDIITGPYAFEGTENMDKAYNLNTLGEIKTNPHRKCAYN